MSLNISSLKLISGKKRRIASVNSFVYTFFHYLFAFAFMRIGKQQSKKKMNGGEEAYEGKDKQEIFECLPFFSPSS